MTRDITDKRAKLVEHLLQEFCTGVAEIIGTEVTDKQVFEEVCVIMRDMVIAMPPVPRNSFLQAMKQIWDWEVEHNPNLRLAAMDISKEFRQ